MINAVCSFLHSFVIPFNFEHFRFEIAQEKGFKIIVIVKDVLPLESLSLPQNIAAFIKNNTYLLSTDPNFTKKLIKALPIKINPDQPLNQQVGKLCYSGKYEIARSKFTTNITLGKGHFGSVYEGCARDIKNSGDKIKVAIKTVNNPCDKTEIYALWCEIKVLDNLDKHLNLVNMFAACTQNCQRGQIWLLLEFCPHGDLKKLLAKHRQSHYT